MSVLTWRTALGPPLVAAAAVAAVTAVALVGPTLAAPDAGAVASRTASAIRSHLAAPRVRELERCTPASSAGRAGRAAAPGPTWVRLDPLLDGRGALAGQRLTTGALGAPPAAAVDLDAESFVAAPLDGWVLAGTDDGRRSTLRVFDARSGCVAAMLESRGLVRRALLDPAREAIVEFRLERGTRADEGIWLRPLDGGSERPLAGPLPANPRLGLVFSTELTWSAERDRIVVTSCGEAACLVRVVDPSGGAVVTIDDGHVGEAIGLVGSTLVAYAGCPSLPCDVVTHDLTTGRTRVVARLAGLASLVAGGAEPQIVAEDYASGGLAIVALDGRRVARMAAPDGLRLVPAVHRAGGAVEAPAGLAAFGQAGRPGPDGSLVRLEDRRIVSAVEVAP